MFSLQKFLEHKITNILFAVFVVIVGIVLFIVNFYVATESVMKLNLHFNIPMICKYILIVANTLTWAFILSACRKEYLEKEITRFWYRVGVIFFFMMIAGMFVKIPYLWRISYILVGLIWMGIAVMSGFLIKIVLQEHPVRIV